MIQKFLARFAGKMLAKKLKLEDNMQSETTEKKWYLSRTIWIAIVTVVLSAVDVAGKISGHPITIPDWVYAILTGAGLYTARVGNSPIK